MNSRIRLLLAGTIGVSLSIGLLFALYIPSSLYWGSNMSSYTFTSEKTGIPVEKLILLNYFIFMPWSVTNLMRVEHFKQVDYDDPVEESGGGFALFHSLFFLLGALIAVALSGTGVPRQEDTILQQKRKVYLPPWIIYTLLTLVTHLALMGAAATYYTGPGGPVWLYPSPLFLIPFGVGIGVISYVTQAIYTGLLNAFSFR